MQRGKPSLLESTDPTHVDVVDRHGIEIVQFLPPPLDRHNEIRRLQQHEMLGDCLTTHVVPCAQLAEREAVLLAQPVKQLPAAGISQRLEHFVVIGTHAAIICNRMVACQEDYSGKVWEGEKDQRIGGSVERRGINNS